MGSFSPAGAWRTLRVLALCAVVAGTIAAVALAAGPGGWDHLGDRGTPGSESLDARRLRADVDAGSALRRRRASTTPAAFPPRIGSRRGTAAAGARSARRTRSSRQVAACSTSPCPAARSTPVAASQTRAETRTPTSSRSGTVRAGSRSALAGRAASFNGNVHSLQIIGQTLYVGGAFQNGAGFASADYLLACNLATGASSPVVHPAHPFSGPVYALSADGSGTLYAGGNFDHRRASRPPTTSPTSRGRTWNAMGGVTRHRPRSHRRRDRRLRRHGREQRRRHPAGRPRREMGRVGVGGRGCRQRWRDGWFPAGTSIYALTGTARTSSSPGCSRTRTATRAPTDVAFFDGTAGIRSGPTAPATAR